MTQKGRPEDFLYNGIFSEPKMPRCLPKTIRFVAFVLILLSSLAGLWAQNSAPVPSISLPGSQSPFTGSEPEGKVLRKFCN